LGSVHAGGRWRQVSRCQGEANPRDRPRVDVAAYIRLFIC
jgi:hypothetical protein